MTNNPFSQSELTRLALVGLDTQIAELITRREQLAAMVSEKPTVVPVLPSELTQAQPVAETKQFAMSDATRAKISANMKAKWAKKKAAKKVAAKGKVSAK